MTIEKVQFGGGIAPLFWQHGEDEATLRNEIQHMSAKGIGGFIVESRPHPDFLGEKWWTDLDVLLDEAKRQEMKVWLFDDSHFPSGYVNGIIRDKHPELMKVYVGEHHIDAVGPRRGSSFMIRPWLNPGEQLIGVIAALRREGTDGIDGNTLADLTDRVEGGVLYWDIPEGSWRVFILKTTRNGGEKETRDYLNPIDRRAVRAHLDYVYEVHYARYGDEFGKTIAGFFQDEFRFGNAPAYNAVLGAKNMEYTYGGMEGPTGCYEVVLPYSEELAVRLDQAWEGGFRTVLPLLWYEGGELTHQARYTFMDTVSTLMGECYAEQIGSWCSERGVRLIGHFVEDNGAHARLGFGCGHFFRAMKGQGASGMDVVYQIWPGYTSGRHQTPFGYLDADFFYWGLAKLASSAGHLDPKKQGMTVCEIFGAYGWQEGLKLMKWLTDHVCVRGVNYLIPHAFSPKSPDPDCPPHFYNQGVDIQWKYFDIWSSYANRLCAMLTDGRHAAPVAVIYHAEAEWAGRYQPFEAAVKALAQRQIDCDIVPIDMLVQPGEASLQDGVLMIGGEAFRAIVVPYAQRLPEAFMQALLVLAQGGLPVWFLEDYPEGMSRSSARESALLAELRAASGIAVCSTERISETLLGSIQVDVTTADYVPSLRNYHYLKDGEQIFLFTNESPDQALHTTVMLKAAGVPRLYCALTDKSYSASYQRQGEELVIGLALDRYESLFVIISPEDSGIELLPRLDTAAIKSGGTAWPLVGDWVVDTTATPNEPDYTPEPRIKGPGNVAVPALLPAFSGTIRYTSEQDFGDLTGFDSFYLDLGDVYEIAELWINDRLVGSRICPPYAFEVTDYLQEGKNSFRIYVTNTLAKRLGEQNVFDRSMPQEPSGWIGPAVMYGK